MARAWMKAALAGMAIMAMTAPVHAADTIKIGVPGAHSGDLVSYGMPSLNAARIVADEYNAKGGILGKQIEIVAEDDQCKPELGTNAATKVLSEGAVAVMGSICSGATKAALLEAIKAAGSTDSQKIMEALRTNMVETPLGKIKFDAKGDAEGIGFSIYEVKDGKFVELK